ncbi:hypothetical protein AB0F46_23770 [Streptomyces sp. NPDC026665]|uniref:hypothetical protein n=1 Tax=Streptomyces sp. NPDC026665 TaxID=3154798 RepID=UPI0033D1D3EA
MTSTTERPRWWFALRGGAAFLVGGALGLIAYEGIRRHSIASAPWSGLLLGTVVAAAFGALFPRRERRRRGKGS